MHEQAYAVLMQYEWKINDVLNQFFDNQVEFRKKLTHFLASQAAKGVCAMFFGR